MAATRSSPCRPRSDAKPHPHACSLEHADLVRGYRDARYAYEQRREAECHAYETETREYDRAHGGGMTFKLWLTSMRGDR